MLRSDLVRYDIGKTSRLTEFLRYTTHTDKPNFVSDRARHQLMALSGLPVLDSDSIRSLTGVLNPSLVAYTLWCQATTWHSNLY